MTSKLHITNSFAWIGQLATPCVLIVREMSPGDLATQLVSGRTSLLVDDATAAAQILQQLHIPHYAIARTGSIAPEDTVVVAVGDTRTRCLVIEVAQ
jgi:hypothetical protein